MSIAASITSEYQGDLSQDADLIYESASILGLDGILPPRSRGGASYQRWALVQAARESVGMGEHRDDLGHVTGIPWFAHDPSLFGKDHVWDVDYLRFIGSQVGVTIGSDRTRSANSLASHYSRKSVLFKGDDSFIPIPGDIFFIGTTKPWSAVRAGIVESVEGKCFIGIVGDSSSSALSKTDYRVSRIRYKTSAVTSGEGVIGYVRLNLPDYPSTESLLKSGQVVSHPVPNVGEIDLYDYGLALTRQGLMSGPLSLRRFTPAYDSATRRAADRFGCEYPKAGMSTLWIAQQLGFEVDEDQAQRAYVTPGFLHTQRLWLEKVRRNRVKVSALHYGSRGSDSVRHLQQQLRLRGAKCATRGDLEVTGNYFDNTARCVDATLANFGGDTQAMYRHLFPRTQFRLI